MDRAGPGSPHVPRGSLADLDELDRADGWLRATASVRSAAYEGSRCGGRPRDRRLVGRAAPGRFDVPRPETDD
jgi:hypothetical protein